MPSEWPIAAPPVTGRSDRPPTALPVSGERRLASVVQDFFLPLDARLTEQERALMTAMLHGLIERIADELRARLDDDRAQSCAATAAELIADLSRASLLQDETLVGVLLRRADVQRLAQTGHGGRTTLQRWTAHEDGEIAAAAMAVVTARGRGRDRYGRAALDLGDLPPVLAQGLVLAVAAALGARCSEPSDVEVASAAAQIIRERPEPATVEELEVALALALGPDGRRAPGLLVALAQDGEAPMIAALLSVEAGIAADEAWRSLLAGGEQVALLLRLANVPRIEAAAFLANAGPALGLGDPVQAIEQFDRLAPDDVEAVRRELVLPPSYRRAKAILHRRG